MLSISLLSKIRPVYHTRGLAYVCIQAVGVTNCRIKNGVINCRIKNGVTNCRIKKMVEHTDNQKSVKMPRIKLLSTISGTDKLMYHGFQR